MLVHHSIFPALHFQKNVGMGFGVEAVGADSEFCAGFHPVDFFIIIGINHVLEIQASYLVFSIRVAFGVGVQAHEKKDFLFNLISQGFRQNILEFKPGEMKLGFSLQDGSLLVLKILIISVIVRPKFLIHYMDLLHSFILLSPTIFWNKNEIVVPLKYRIH